MLTPMVAQAQLKVESQVSTVILDAEGYQKAGSVIIVPPGDTPKYSKVGLLLLSGSEGYAVDVNASNQKREPVRIEQVGDEAYLVYGAGKTWVHVDAIRIDFDEKVYDRQKKEVILDIGDVPPDPPPTPPGPGPTPTPDDTTDFDGITQRVQGLASGLPNNAGIAKSYKDAADMLLNDLSKSTNDVTEFLKGSIKGLNNPDYTETFRVINADIAMRWDVLSNDRSLLAKYLTCVSNGFGGVR